MSTEIKYGSSLEAEKHRFYNKKKSSVCKIGNFGNSEKDFTVVGPTVVGPARKLIAPETTNISIHQIHKIHV